MKKQLAAVAVSVSVLSVLPAASASAQTSASGDVIAEHVTMTTVLDGPMGVSAKGNQHRLVFRTDTASLSNPRHAAKIQSYYCPSGSRITATWASSRCVYRGTSFLTYDRSDYRVSSTMRSARVEGRMESGERAFLVDLALYATGEAWDSEWPEDADIFFVNAKVSGTINGAVARPGQGGMIHRYVSV